MYELEVLKKIRNQLAHTFARYGDEPEELIYKLECLIIEWMEKAKQVEST